jgi:hypothetical protein
LLHQRDWPKYVDPIREIYEPEELSALFRRLPAGRKSAVFILFVDGNAGQGSAELHLARY